MIVKINAEIALYDYTVKMKGRSRVLQPGTYDVEVVHVSGEDPERWLVLPGTYNGLPEKNWREIPGFELIKE